MLLAASSGISCLGCGVSPLSHRELICSFRFGRHVFGDRARTKVPGHATPSFGFDMDARDLVLQDWSNNEIVRCLEGSSKYGVAPGSLFTVDVVQRAADADFVPYVPCGVRSQCLSVITHSGSSSGRCIRVARDGFISP